MKKKIAIAITALFERLHVLIMHFNGEFKTFSRKEKEKRKKGMKKRNGKKTKEIIIQKAEERKIRGKDVA